MAKKSMAELAEEAIESRRQIEDVDIISVRGPDENGKYFLNFLCYEVPATRYNQHLIERITRGEIELPPIEEIIGDDR